MKDKEFWYNLDKIRSYNALFNFIILLRGVGKTYAFKKFAISQALNGGGQFVYLRRTEVELRDSMDSFIRDVGKEWPQYTFRVHLNKLQYNIADDEKEGEYLGQWETLGYFAYLSNSRRKKSVSYDGVKYMAFDEFLIPANDRYAHYLPDEVTQFFEFYETVARMRDVQVFFLSNAMSTVNPYFLFFNLRLPRTKSGITRIKEDIVIEYHDNPEYREAKEQTRFGKLISGTRFSEYAVGNKFIDENEDFIAKKPGNAYYNFSIMIDDRKMGVYKIPRQETYIISDDYNPECPSRWSYLITEPGFRMFKGRRQSILLNRLVQSFIDGNLFFENQMIKQAVISMIERIM